MLRLFLTNFPRTEHFPVTEESDWEIHEAWLKCVHLVPEAL
jgi:hypothetical protein